MDEDGKPIGEGHWELAVDDEAYWTHSPSNGINGEGDPPSVAFELGRWEDDFRLTLGVPAATEPATVTAAASFISSYLTWAGREHPAFPELATDVRKLLAILVDATSTGSRPERAQVACFDCGTDALERRYSLPKPCKHPVPDFTPWAPGTANLMQLAWRDEHTCDQGGRVEDWTCAACGRKYDAEHYYLAYTAWLEDQDSDEPVDAYYASAYLSSRLGRSVTPKQIRHWAERGQIAVVQPSEGGKRTLYDFADIRRRAERMRAG